MDVIIKITYRLLCKYLLTENSPYFTSYDLQVTSGWLSMKTIKYRGKLVCAN